MADQNPQERLEYQGDMHPVFERVATAYELGSLLGFELILVGYEDYNAAITTSKGKYFAKVFAAFRGETEIQRYDDMMRAIMDGEVNHPKIHTCKEELIYSDTETACHVLLMDYVTGKSFYELQRTPTTEELTKVFEQAVRIHAIPYQPSYLYDSWAIPNLAETYDLVKEHISDTEEGELIERVISSMEDIDHDALPHAFVHGDLVKSNVILGEHNEIYVIDFSVANWYPRIQELAVIVGNLINGDPVERDFLDTLKYVVKGYIDAGGVLTRAEMQALPIYAQAAYASEYVGALKEKLVEGNESTENEYWLNTGLSGLKKSFA